MQKEAAIIIPCYNEEKRLPVEDIKNYLKNPGVVKLFFVDDGSTDKTSALIQSLEKEFPGDVTAIVNKINKGKAETIRQAVLNISKQADFSFYGFFDADLSTPLYEIDNFLQIFEEKPDLVMVMGSRIKRLGASITRSWKRHILGRIFASAVSRILQMPVYDTQCGAKLFRSKETKKAFEQKFISKWLFDVELIGRIILDLGYEKALNSIYECPLKFWSDDGNSRIKTRDLFTIPLDLMTIREKYSHRIKSSKKNKTSHG